MNDQRAARGATQGHILSRQCSTHQYFHFNKWLGLLHSSDISSLHKYLYYGNYAHARLGNSWSASATSTRAIAAQWFHFTSTYRFLRLALPAHEHCQTFSYIHILREWNWRITFCVNTLRSPRTMQRRCAAVETFSIFMVRRLLSYKM